jgi:hypothetical protein
MRGMSVAPDWVEAARIERGLDRLLGHCGLLDRMTAGTRRASARERLERELGPELVRLLLSGLSSAA